jgi:hypothetical protein
LVAGHRGSINNFVTTKSGWQSPGESSPVPAFGGEMIREGQQTGEHRSNFHLAGLILFIINSNSTDLWNKNLIKDKFSEIFACDVRIGELQKLPANV